MPFRVRQATVSDTLQLSVLFRQVYIQTYAVEGVTMEFANFIAQQFSEEKIKKDVRSKDCDIWVATSKNNPVGIAQVEYNKKCPVGDLIAPEINKEWGNNKTHILAGWHPIRFAVNS